MLEKACLKISKVLLTKYQRLHLKLKFKFNAKHSKFAEMWIDDVDVKRIP